MNERLPLSISRQSPESHWYHETDARTTDDSSRVLWLAVRQALLIVLGAVETYLGLERTVIPKRKR